MPFKMHKIIFSPENLKKQPGFPRLIIPPALKKLKGHIALGLFR